MHLCIFPGGEDERRVLSIWPLARIYLISCSLINSDSSLHLPVTVASWLVNNRWRLPNVVRPPCSRQGYGDPLSTRLSSQFLYIRRGYPIYAWPFRNRVFGYSIAICHITVVGELSELSSAPLILDWKRGRCGHWRTLMGLNNTKGHLDVHDLR